MRGWRFDSWPLALALGWLVASYAARGAFAAPAAEVDARPSIDLQRVAAWLEPRRSPAEAALLADAADGAWHNHTLLAAALTAEGISPRQTAGYADELSAWADELRRLPGDSRHQAKAALALLHQRALKHYEPQASSVAGVFAENRYNCLGSTILFTALAQRMGWECWAIERPGHVLARLRLDGRALDVETTCMQGVGMTQPDAADERALSPVALVGLVYFNRGCDLLARGEFSSAMSANLAALRLDPANARAGNNLLGAWNNWALALARQGHARAASGLLHKGLELAPAYALFSANMRAIAAPPDDADKR